MTALTPLGWYFFLLLCASVGLFAWWLPLLRPLLAFALVACVAGLFTLHHWRRYRLYRRLHHRPQAEDALVLFLGFACALAYALKGVLEQVVGVWS